MSKKKHDEQHCETRICIRETVKTGRLIHIAMPDVWLGGVVVGRRIRDREVASSIPGCSAAKCNSGQVVHTRVPLFTEQYKLVPASAGE